MIRSIQWGRAMRAGLLGTVVMTLAMYGGPLVGLPRMDVLGALGGAFPSKLSPYVTGALIHVGIGISLALIYALFFDSWLPGPDWFRGALFSLVPWLFAITLLTPSLLLVGQLFKGGEAVAANPCAVQPVNPCSVSQPGSNPCAAGANPCAVANPCGAGQSAGGPSPQVMSLMVHLLYGAVLGVAYRPSSGR